MAINLTTGRPQTTSHGNEYDINVTDKDSHQLLIDILRELRYMNFMLAEMTNSETTAEEVNDDFEHEDM